MDETGSPEQPAQDAGERPRVLYVMGAGRSGSTTLGITLGNCEGVFYAGELDAWLSRHGEPQVSDPERDRFWGLVRERVQGAEPLYGHEAERAIERSMSLFRIRRWSQRRRLREPYRRVSESVYRAITATSGEPVIVDTSHYPLRARELQAADGIDLHILYLVRDPQRVVDSFNRRDVAQYSKSTLTTNVYLWLTNLLAVLVFLRQPPSRRLFVSYEDFTADPAGVVRAILELVGSGAAPPDFDALATGIPFQGNRVMRTDAIALRPPEPSERGHDPVTSVAQMPWRVAHARLRPRTSARASERVDAIAQ
jgi:hypothetical protein